MGQLPKICVISRSLYVGTKSTFWLCHFRAIIVAASTGTDFALNFVWRT